LDSFEEEQRTFGGLGTKIQLLQEGIHPKFDRASLPAKETIDPGPMGSALPSCNTSREYVGFD
jgi:hypothetical protein